MAPAPRARVVFNPTAGRHPERRQAQFAQLCRALEGHGWRLSDSGAAEVVIACGGDGTLHAVLQELAPQEATTRPALGVAPPFGTANVLAHALGVPGHPEAAAAWLHRAWQQGPRQLPVGVAETAAGARYFLTMAGAGYDAYVVRTVTEAAKRRWGRWAFAACAATAWRQYFPAPLALDCAPHQADGLIYSLIHTYAGRLRLGRMPPSGPLVLALTGAPLWLPLQALALATVGLAHAPGVRRLDCQAVAIATAGRPLQLDGEAAGTTPVRLRLHPDGVRFLAPR